MNEHDLVVRVQELARELGQTPTREQFHEHCGVSMHRIRQVTGGFSGLVAMAGLAPGKHHRPTNAIFEKDLERHLEEYKPREVKERKPYPTVAIISDIHWPFENPKVITRFLEYVGDVKPEHVVINGDAWDMYSHTKFPKSQNIFTPEQEEKMSRERNEKFWLDVKKMSPASKCTQMLGNHEIRPVKRVLESVPSLEHFVARYMKEIFTFPDVTTFHDHREEFQPSEDILIFHGYRSKLGSHRDFTLMNTCNGHTHHGGTVFRHIRGETLWELNSGLAGDPESKGLSYTAQKWHDMTPGFGAVARYAPMFIPC